MRSGWKRLLVAIDGSLPSLRALEYSLRIVPKSDLELMVLLHVYNIPTAAYFSSQAEFRMKLDIYMQNQIKGWVEPILQHEYKEDINIVLQLTTTIKLEALATSKSISNSIDTQCSKSISLSSPNSQMKADTGMALASSKYVIIFSHYTLDESIAYCIYVK